MTSLQALNSCSDVELDIEAQIDRTTLTVRQILELAPASLIRLDRAAGEHIDVLAGGAPIGRGEIMLSHNKAAIRLTKLASR